jgi:EAL domain-containing protein (putative c-di-GMP-specific phosphodiesterase class I)
LKVTASLGVSCYPQAEAVDAEQLLRQADQAMYQAKKAGKSTYRFFDAHQDILEREQLEALSRLEQALEQQEFVLYFQPKVNMRTGQVIGVEALIRWQHPQQGLLSPAAFLPALAGQALMVKLGDWVLEAAVQQLAGWQQEGLDLPISVNVDAIQLGQQDFISKLQQVLQRYPQVNPADLELEVLETGALNDIQHTAQLIRECHALGVRLSLDDFGTGYSSLAYLKHLEVDVLKIDQGFVRDMLHDPDDLVILGGIIGLADAFGRGLIAEGVETPESVEFLLQLGCECGQGYAIARPMPAAAIPAWVQDWQPQAAWRDTPLLGRETWYLLQAMVEHRAWVMKLRAYLLGHSTALPRLDHRDCKLGQHLALLLDVAAQEDSSETRWLRQMAERHEATHRHARDAVTAARERNPSEAFRQLDEVELLTLQLGQLLRQRLSEVSMTRLIARANA